MPKPLLENGRKLFLDEYLTSVHEGKKPFKCESCTEL